MQNIRFINFFQHHLVFVRLFSYVYDPRELRLQLKDTQIDCWAFLCILLLLSLLFHLRCEFRCGWICALCLNIIQTFPAFNFNSWHYLHAYYAPVNIVDVPNKDDQLSQIIDPKVNLQLLHLEREITVNIDE